MTTTDDDHTEPDDDQAPAYDTRDVGQFEGKPVVGIVTSIKGTSSRVTRPIHPGERLYAVVELVEDGISHKPTKDGRKRYQTLDAEDFYELTDAEGRDLIAGKRAELLESGQLDGQLRIGDGAPALTVDASGVALTPVEIAEAQGGVNGVDQLAPGPLSEPWIGYEDQSVGEIRERIGVVETVDVCTTVIAFENARSRPRQQVINAASNRATDLEAAER